MLALWADEEQGGAVHHARPRRGHRDERPRGGDERGARVASDRRVRDRPARGRATWPRCALRRASSSCTSAIWDVLRDEVLRRLPAATAAHGLIGDVAALCVQQPATCAGWQVGVLVAVFALWHVLTTPGWCRRCCSSDDQQAAFFFGEPLKIFGRIARWFFISARHLRAPGGDAARDRARVRPRHRARPGAAACGSRCRRWPPRSSTLHQGAELDATRDPGADLRGVVRPRRREQGGAGHHAGVLHRLLQRLSGRDAKSARWCSTTRACSAPIRRQLLRHVYLPSATSWVFSSLHTSVGLAFVGAVVGEYLGSSRGVGYLILQAEGTLRHQHRDGRHPGADCVCAGCSTRWSGASSGG